MISVLVSAYFCFATLEQFLVYDFRINIIVNLAVYFIPACVFFAVKNDVDICGSERLAAIEDAAFRKTYGNFVAAFTGGVSLEDFFYIRTFFTVDKDLFLLGVVAVIESTCTMQSFYSSFSLSASCLLR